MSVFYVQYLDKEFTLWDRFEVNAEMTVKQFIDHFKVTQRLYCQFSRLTTIVSYISVKAEQSRPYVTTVPISTPEYRG